MIDPVDTVTRPLPVVSQTPISMRFTADGRIYNVVLMQDLFEQWIVMQSWGGKFNQRGGGKTKLVKDFNEGIAQLHAIAKRREKHGYKLIT